LEDIANIFQSIKRTEQRRTRVERENIIWMLRWTLGLDLRVFLRKQIRLAGFRRPRPTGNLIGEHAAFPNLEPILVKFHHVIRKRVPLSNSGTYCAAIDTIKDYT
jgi:hypothetical protein